MTNSRLIKALLREPVDRPPIWLMRQAGRYMPEYRKVRSQVKDFMQLCYNPELACEVALQPIAAFDLDAAILFSDILTIPHALGTTVRFVESQGPVIDNTIRTQADLEQLQVSNAIEQLEPVFEAVRLTKAALPLDKPLIGFAGSPWTVATYMVEGGSSKGFAAIKKMAYKTPAVLHQLLGILADTTATYLNAQIAAGANAVMLFDTWGGVLSYQAYPEFSLKYMQRVMQQLNRRHNDQPIPVILFTKGGGLWLEQIAASGCDAMGLDWTVSLTEAHRRTQGHVALQGNCDPAILYADRDVIVKTVRDLLQEAQPLPGYVFNLGHGIMPDINPDHVKILVDTVLEASS